MKAYWFKDPDVIYVRMPKVASRTILTSFFQRRSPTAILPSEIPVVVPSFTVVRHPYTRIESCLAMFTDENGYFKKHVPVDITLEWVLSVIKDPAIIVGNGQFPAFFKVHALPASDPYFNLSAVDRIFKYEDIEASWAEMAQFSGLDHVPPMVRIGARRWSPVALTSTEKDLVYECYKKDFEMFGYEK